MCKRFVVDLDNGNVKKWMYNPRYARTAVPDQLLMERARDVLYKPFFTTRILATYVLL